ncbi:hypothetical protein ACN47E_005927 [Coniothyrium glycines]
MQVLFKTLFRPYGQSSLTASPFNNKTSSCQGTQRRRICFTVLRCPCKTQHFIHESHSSLLLDLRGIVATQAPQRNRTCAAVLQFSI